MPDEDRRQTLSPPGGEDQRVSARLNLLIRPAKLVGAEGEFLCVLRDVSNGGCKVRLFHPLPLRGGMKLELGNGDRYEVERVWERDEHAGLRFLSPVPPEYVINEDGPYRKRPVRLRLQLDALIVAGRDTAPAVLRDLSQQGARLDCESRLAVDQQVRLEVAGIRPIVAKVRWRREGAIGLVFEQTFRLDELARIVAALQAPAAGGVAGVRCA